MKKFYVASSFINKEAVRFVSQCLIDNNFIHTYDWTKHDRASTFDDLKSIGNMERTAVLESDFIIIILPAGKGSHIELGIALGQGKQIYLYSPDGAVDNLDTTSTFYHLENIEKCSGTITDLIKKVLLTEQ